MTPTRRWKLSAERAPHPETYRGELDVQAGRIVPAAALVCLVVWLPYIELDRELVPGQAALPWLRAGLSALGLIVLMAWRFLPQVRASVLAAIIVFYLQWATGLLTGLTGGHPAYMGGYVLVLMLAPVAPTTRAALWASLAGSLVLFGVAGALTTLDLRTEVGRYSLTDLITAASVSALLVYVLDRARRRSWEKSREIARQRSQLATDNARIDALLLNILPPAIAAELKAEESVAPRSYASATVVFTDFVGFTHIAERVTPEELLAELDHCFSYFDTLMDRYGLEKLKTIGDAYMFAGGIPEPNASHPVDAVLAALALQRFMAELSAERRVGAHWSLRVGVHTGPLIAGVVGQKKFVYDVWGDTVNLASRMEAAGRGGEVNISATTRAQVGHLFEVVSRGEIPAKHKGMVEMFFVKGIRPEYSVGGEGIQPNQEFHARYRAMARGGA